MPRVFTLVPLRHKLLNDVLIDRSLVATANCIRGSDCVGQRGFVQLSWLILSRRRPGGKRDRASIDLGDCHEQCPVAVVEVDPNKSDAAETAP